MQTTEGRRIILSRSACLLLALCLLLQASPVRAVPGQAYQSYVRGLMASRAGDVPGAVREYEQVIALDQGAASVYRELALLYWQAGDSRKSLEAAGTFGELASEDVATYLFLGSFYQFAGKSDQARAAWENVLKLDPGNDAATLYLAAYHLGSDPGRAAEYWAKHVKQDPGSAEAHYQLGQAYEKTGELTKARDAFQKAANLKPDSLDPHLSLAQVYEKEEKKLAAAQEYELALEIDPGNLTVMLYLGGLYYRIGNFPAAEETFAKAQRVSPEDISIHFWLGILAEERKDWKSAIEHFEFLASKESNPVILTRLSYYYSMLRDYRRAQLTLEKLVAADPRNPNSHFLLGLAFVDQRKYRRAERSFHEALSLNPGFQEIQFHLGALYDQWGKFDKAVESLEKAISLNARNATALNYLGYSYADRGVKLPEAERLVQSALEIEPENGAYLDSLGWVYFRQGRFEDAESQLRRAADLLPDPVVWEHLGDARVKLGKHAEAWDAYHRASDLSTDKRKIRRKIRKIQHLVLPQTIQRKVLKRAVGNLAQVASLQASIILSGEVSDVNLRAFGLFRYRRPEQWRVDLFSSLLAPNTVIIQDKGLTVLPRVYEEAVSPLGHQVVGRIGDYFNTTAVEEFDSDQTRTSANGDLFYYRLGDKSLLVDGNDGTVRQYKVDEQVVLCFRRYRNVEGLYLPSEIEVSVPSDRMFLRIKLRNFVLNQNMDDDIFSATGEGTAR